MKIKYNLILVITDRLIKYKYFISYKKVSSVEKLVYTFLRVIIANNRLSKEIISDWDKLFTFRF